MRVARCRTIHLQRMWKIPTAAVSCLQCGLLETKNKGGDGCRESRAQVRRARESQGVAVEEERRAGEFQKVLPDS